MTILGNNIVISRERKYTNYLMIQQITLQCYYNVNYTIRKDLRMTHTSFLVLWQFYPIKI